MSLFCTISSGTVLDTIVEGLEIESLGSQSVATHQERPCQPDYCEAIYMFLCFSQCVFIVFFSLYISEEGAFFSSHLLSSSTFAAWFSPLLHAA